MNDQVSGIVIQHREYREHDAMLHVVIEDGQILSMVAKGIQKVKSKNASACQLFTKSRFILNLHETSNLHTLRSAEIIDSYRMIREDLYKQSIASYICECLDHSAFEENMFPMLCEIFDILSRTSHPLRILCLFQAIVNRMHGIEPYVDGCVRCGALQHIHAISNNSGGFICINCYQTIDKKKNSEELKRFRLLCKAEMKHYSILETSAEFQFSDFMELYEFFQEYAGVQVRSIRFLKHLYSMEENLK